MWIDSARPWDGFKCATCGELHPGLPQSYGADFPDPFVKLSERERQDEEGGTLINSDQCVIRNEEYYIRGIVELPIMGFPKDSFLWGLWARVWKADFEEMQENWEVAGREQRCGPYKGRIANAIKEVYPSSLLNVRCSVHLKPLGERPIFIIEEPDHPLTNEQRNGITLERVAEIAAVLLHPKEPSTQSP